MKDQGATTEWIKITVLLDWEDVIGLYRVDAKGLMTAKTGDYRCCA
ncbi:hypothetical protein V2K88_02905 [Pseudomonas alliivorans]|nr:hypothetical protein [Pseudomonas alliivorans]